MRHAQAQAGFVVLLAVLIIGAVALSIALALLGGGADSQRTTLTSQRSLQARHLADACAEEALQQIQAVTSYTGTASLTLGQGSCSYTVANPGGANRTITASGTVGDTVRRLQLNATIGTSINVTTWQDTP